MSMTSGSQDRSSEIVDDEDENFMYGDNYLLNQMTMVSSTESMLGNKKMLPVTILAARTIQTKDSKRIMRAMLDSGGGSHTMISTRVIPVGATPTTHNKKLFRAIDDGVRVRRTMCI